ncbi:MAG: glycosyltransferase family 39 protein, partial [Chloroflexota bacterium]|nr:glycosyltransferase family 39 protein [Chloroflexota bacterium]
MIAKGRDGPGGRRARFEGAAWLWVGLGLGLSLLVRWPFLGVPMIADEGGYASVTARWIAGDGRLYDELWISRPQGIFVAYRLIFALVGTSTEAIRLGAWVVAAATLVVVWGFARARSGPRVAALATLMFAVVVSSPSIEGYTANAEVFMAFPAALAAWLLLRASREGWGWWPLALSGVLIGAAILLKPSGVVMLPVALLYTWLVAPVALHPLLRRWGIIFAGLSLALAPALIHGWLVGWDAYIYAALTYRLTEQSGVTASFDHQLTAFLTLLGRVCELLLLLAGTLVLRERVRWRRGLAWGGALQTAARAGIVAPGLVPRRLTTPAGDADFLLRLWLLGGLAGVAMGGDWWSHYLIQVAAPFALWFAGLVVAANRGLPRWGRRAFAVVVIAALLGPYWVVIKGDPERMAETLFSHPGYPMQTEVADYVRERTQPGTEIYVAFDQAAIYYLADRPAAYRHMYDQELRALPNAYDDL